MISEVILTALPAIASTAGTAVITLICKTFVKSVGKKKDEEIKNISEENATLKEQNVKLNKSIENLIIGFASRMDKIEKETHELAVSVNEDIKLTEKCDKLLDKMTTVKNQLTTMLKEKE